MEELKILKINNLSFKYPQSEKYALSNINLTLDEGDFLILGGFSGCGKTTLLRSIKPEIAPVGEKSGEIFYKDKRLSDLSPLESASEIGYVSQNPDNQIVTDRVSTELAFGLENLGTESSEIRRRVAEMASFFGIGSWFHKKTSELSGGQKQILNLAAVLLMQPKLLLLDEPTAMLDPVSAHEFISIVARLQKEFSVTVIMSEHRLGEVLPMSSKIAIMENGKIKYLENPREIASVLKKNSENGYLESMPVPARIFAEISKDGGALPLSEKEGKEKLRNTFKDLTVSEIPVEKKSEVRDTAVEVRDLLFKYESAAPLCCNNLSLKINKGEIFSLLGENGCGKSTLLNLLAGVLKPISGKIKIDGKNIKKYKEKELYCENLAFLPQNPKPLFIKDKLGAELSGAENLAEKFGLTKLFMSHPYDLSCGELEKAAFVKILMRKPKILLLDEVTKGMDAVSKITLGKTLQGLRDKGVTVILSTHDIEFAAEFSDRCALMFDGNIAAVGSPREFFSKSYFYTTSVSRMTRDFFKNAVTPEDVINLCKK